MLDTKGLEFQIVFVDLDENAAQKTDMVKSSGSRVLPQMHVNGKFLGLYSDIQDMEDTGALNGVLSDHGLKPSGKQIAATPRNTARNTESDGPMVVHCTTAHALIKWVPTKADVDTNQEFQWLLLMDDEPVYVGTQTTYSVPNPTPGMHRFELSAVTPEGEFIEDANGEQVLAEVCISPPTTQSPSSPPKTSRLLSARPSPICIPTANFMEAAQTARMNVDVDVRMGTARTARTTRMNTQRLPVTPPHSAEPSLLTSTPTSQFGSPRPGGEHFLTPHTMRRRGSAKK